MPYVNAKQMILDAREGGYAVPAFNAENLEMVQAIIGAAE
ncbi:MAG: class II fructose-bisphosphate aldolase, partial [Clostridia bacterium]|nr:class II fructose-bisphosphate aldolase [Clostridia bacterium]